MKRRQILTCSPPSLKLWRVNPPQPAEDLEDQNDFQLVAETAAEAKQREAKAEKAEKLAREKAKKEAAKNNPVNEDTRFYHDAKELDNARSSGYWSGDVELFARAFSSFIEDKLKEQGRKSEYLSFGSNNDLYDWGGISVFPGGEERTRINQAFQDFFDEMKYEETSDGKVRLYSVKRVPKSIEDYRNMEFHPRPEKAKFSSVKELYDIYKKEYLGKTFNTISGQKITFKPGHFFRLIAGTPQEGVKGWIAKAKNANDAIRMIEKWRDRLFGYLGVSKKKSRKHKSFQRCFTGRRFLVHRRQRYCYFWQKIQWSKKCRRFYCRNT